MFKKIFVVAVITSSMLAANTLFAQEESRTESVSKSEAPATTEAVPRIQMAILLDNSGSMSGLIDQARGELWRVVNEFVTAKVDGQRPELQVAVYHYGSPPATRLVELTDDLDKVSEALFAIPVSGGSEYCGAVIDAATKELDWSNNPNDLKVIFIAGNEPFSQGPVDYKEACKAAIGKGIIVNTIHCGGEMPTDWRDGAMLADGKAMNIDHNSVVAHIEAPQDEEIAALGVELNKTYIAFGKSGAEGARRQNLQDTNSASSSQGSAQQRAVSKANAYYKNSSWDLCDACKEGKVDLEKIKEEDLPENMRKMTLEERKAYVESKQKEREEISKKINDLNKERMEYVAEKRKEMAEESGEETLDKAMIDAIQTQAKAKNYTFGEEDN